MKLSDVAELSGGFAFKSEQYKQTGHFVLRTVNIRDDCSIDRNGATYISENEAPQFNRFALQEHDTLFVMVGATLGKIGYIRARDLPALLNQNMWVIRAMPGRVDPIYLHYYFRMLSKIPLSWVSGSARGFLRRDDVRNLSVDLPPSDEQRAVGQLLLSIDNKIELNRQMNETLEAMARAIFKDWFVDFGPTRAKMEGRAPYLAPEIWSLFPDRLDDEGKPKGWEAGTLDQIVELNPREQLKAGEVAPYLDMAALPTAGSIADQAVPREFTSGMRFRNGDTLFARITPCLENGKTAFVQGLPENAIGWGSTEFIILRSKSPVAPAYTYLLARDPAFRSVAIQSMTGTSGRQRARSDALGAFPVAIPGEPVWLAFGSIIQTKFQKIGANAKESHILAAIRDLLLPKLMSGEIRVKEASSVVEYLLSEAD